MASELGILVDTSVHYYIPQTAQQPDYLYVPRSVGSFECKPPYGVDRHNYDSYLIIVMLSGALSYSVLNRRGVVRSGQILFIDCRQPHTYKANGRCSFVFLHFTGGHSRELYSVIEKEIGNALHLPSTVAVCEYISEIINSVANDKRIDAPRASQLVYSVLMQLLSANPVNNEGATGDQLIDQALEYIHQHLSEKITVQDIAESIGYNEGHFSRKFAKATGCTPYQYLLRSRIERAEILLQSTSLSIHEIAEQTGFNSVANFSYAFRQNTGCTPHEFRERRF